MIEVLLLPPLLALVVGLLAWGGLRGGSVLHARRVARARRQAAAWSRELGWKSQVSPDGDVTFTHPDQPLTVHGRFFGMTFAGRVDVRTGLPIDAQTRARVGALSEPRFTGDPQLETHLAIDRFDGLALGALDANTRTLLRQVMRPRGSSDQPQLPTLQSGVLEHILSADDPSELRDATAEARLLAQRLAPPETWVAGLRARVLEDPMESVRYQAMTWLTAHAAHEDAALDALYDEVDDPYLRGRIAVALAEPERLLAQLEDPDVPGELHPSLVDALPRPFPEEVLAWLDAHRPDYGLPALFVDLTEREDPRAAEIERLLPGLLDGNSAGAALEALATHGTLAAVEGLHERRNGMPPLGGARRRAIDATIARIQERAGPADAGAVSLAVEDFGAVSLVPRADARQGEET